MNFAKMTTEELEKFEGDHRHGDAFDRGGADSYYQRGRKPHYFTGPTYHTTEIVPEENSPKWNAYMAGFEWNERQYHFKDWG